MGRCLSSELEWLLWRKPNDRSGLNGPGRDEGSRPDNVLEAILELVELGLVNELPGETPAMPVYKLTAEGQGRL